MRHHPDALSPLALRAQARGLFTLPVGQARRRQTRRAGELRVVRGQVWVTFEGPHAGTEAGPQGDVFLRAGERLALPAGARPVLEAVTPRHAALSDAAFSWHADHPLRVGEAMQSAASDLARALADAGHALARLLGGAGPSGRNPWRA